MHMHAARAFPSRACTRTTGNRFVKAPAFNMFAIRVFAARSKGEVVAAPLRRCGCFERFEHDVSDALRGADVPSDDGGCFAWVQNAIGRHLDCDGYEAALI